MARRGGRAAALTAVFLASACLCQLAAAGSSHSPAEALDGREGRRLATFDPTCKHAKPTLFLMSGIGGSQMRGTYNGSGTYRGGSSPDCPSLGGNSTVVWYADKWFWGRHLKCWSHLMSMDWHPETGRWTNSSGVELWPDEAANPGDFPEGSKQALYYAVLLKHLFAHHGYVAGKDFFLLPFDWRTGIQGLEQAAALKRITQRIAAGVKGNCGQKAIIMSHSYGANVMATILQKPSFKQWREKNVRGWIPVGGPFGGCGATPWLSMLSGDFFKLFPFLSNLLPVGLTSSLKPTVVGKSVYNFAFGLPSWGFMMPRPVALGSDHVVVSTPTRNYTVVEQKQLLLDMGDEGGASIMDDSWRRSEDVLKHGPVPGVETWCLYSTSVPTATTLVFNDSVPQRAPITRPFKIVTTEGDGVVDLNSLRLCSKLAPADHLVEVSGPLVDHSTILSHPLGLKRLSGILNKLGVPNAGPLGAFSIGK